MTAVDLTESEIDQLLSSAELALASKPADQSAVAGQQQTKTLAPKASSPSTALVTNNKDTHGKTPEVSLRVPHIRSKEKKVRAAPNFQPSSPMRKSYPKLE